MSKTTKNAAELADKIMAELRKHPECNAVTHIRIIRPVTQNWDVTNAAVASATSADG